MSKTSKVTGPTDQAGRTALTALPEPITVARRGRGLDELLDTEWLVSNRIGAYASSTVLGCNTRRYHGLLVASTAPPVGRIVALSTVMEDVVAGQSVYQLATNEFPDAFSPKGMVHLVEFRNDVAATFVLRLGEMELVKRIILAERNNAVAVQYTLRGGDAVLHLRPFAAMRDFHSLRSVDQPHRMTFEAAGRGLIVQDRARPEHSLYLHSQEATFAAEPQWWNQFLYRKELSRGQDGLEDLYCPGVFICPLTDGRPVQFNASLDAPISPGFDSTTRARRKRLVALAESVPGADEATRRLAVASDAFVVQRDFASSGSSATILAGFHWFADWGRDTFIALPGLLLETGRFDTAREVLTTFAGAISEGMLPNRFDDYCSTGHYNSIDASLWFVIAAERYLAATGDRTFWRDVLMPTARTILDAYQAGTKFDIHADADGLITGGSPGTQLTWMDAKLGEEAITPRHGKAVEVNALWHSAHRIMAERCRSTDSLLSDHYRDQATIIESAFLRAFWDPKAGCLYDCVRDGEVDRSIRPNQLLAVSLPHSPLTGEQRASVLAVVTDRLLTPFGLRTLAGDDPRYRGQYGQTGEQRDRAYHQGMVWPWLIGPYVEAFLKVHGRRPEALDRAEALLRRFDEHLNVAGLGFVSEIFDGQPPHRPRGCIAQAWSVGEVLRAKRLVARCRQGSPAAE